PALDEFETLPASSGHEASGLAERAKLRARIPHRPHVPVACLVIAHLELLLVLVLFLCGRRAVVPLRRRRSESLVVGWSAVAAERCSRRLRERDHVVVGGLVRLRGAVLRHVAAAATAAEQRADGAANHSPEGSPERGPDDGGGNRSHRAKT